MAKDITLDAWVENGANVMEIDTATTPDEFTIPVTAIGITDGTAEDNIHEFTRALLYTLEGVYAGLAAADKPDYFKITKQTKTNSDGRLVETYSAVFIRDIDTTDAPTES